MTNLFTYLSNWKLKYTYALFVLFCAGVGNVWGAASYTYRLVVSKSALVDGKRYILLSGDRTKEYSNSTSSGHLSTTGTFTSSATTAGSAVTTTADASTIKYVTLIKISGDKYKIYDSDGKYVTATKAASGGFSRDASDDYGWTFYGSSGLDAIYEKEYSSKYASFRYRSTSSDFRSYAASSHTSPSTSESCFYLATGCSVTYNANGASSGTVPSDTYLYGEGATVTAKTNSGTLAKSGFTFSGWNTKADGSGSDIATSGTFTITKDTVLYAKWVSACSYKVTLTKGSPTNGSISLNKSNGSYDNCDADFEVIVTPTPDEGYACTEVTESDGTQSIVDGPDGNGKYTVLYNRGYSITSTISATFAAKVATPEMSVSGGTYNTTQSVTLSCDTEDATIYYTTNGSTPTTSSSVYSSAISVTTTNTTIKAIAVKDGMPNSDVASATYVLKCATPTFSPVAGTYTGAQDVAISCGTAGADIFYSTDGTDPDGSNEYSSAINVATSKTLKAIASKTGWTDSDIASAAYTIQYAITWLVNGDEWTPHDPKSDPDDGKVNGSNKVNSGTAWSSLTLPTDPDPASDGCGQEFMGWVTAAIVGKLDKDVPADATAISALDLLNKENKSDKTSETITATTTFYAVFADNAE